jgi:hypothetical protein
VEERPKSSPKARNFMAWGAHAARKHAGQQVLESLVPSRVAVGAPADRSPTGPSAVTDALQKACFLACQKGWKVVKFKPVLPLPRRLIAGWRTFFPLQLKFEKL